MLCKGEWSEGLLVTLTFGFPCYLVGFQTTNGLVQRGQMRQNLQAKWGSGMYFASNWGNKSGHVATELMPYRPLLHALRIIHYAPCMRCGCLSQPSWFWFFKKQKPCGAFLEAWHCIIIPAEESFFFINTSRCQNSLHEKRQHIRRNIIPGFLPVMLIFHMQGVSDMGEYSQNAVHYLHPEKVWTCKDCAMFVCCASVCVF